MTDGRTLVAIGSQAVESTRYPGNIEPRGAVWTSGDGVTWQVFPDPTAASPAAGWLPAFTSIVSTPIGFAATAMERDASTGLDQASVWLITATEPVMLARGGELTGSTMAAVTWTGTQLVAVGWRRGGLATDGSQLPDQAVTWRSTDARSWSRIELPVGLGTGEMRSVAVLGRTIVAAGVDSSFKHAVLWRSADGGQWQRTDLPRVPFDPSNGPIVQATANGFVVIMQGPPVTALTSPNGVEWSAVAPPRDPAAASLARVGGSTALPGDRLLIVGSRPSGEVRHATVPAGILLSP